ncbi:alpha/beta hydrolase [soil metagenome]
MVDVTVQDGNAGMQRTEVVDGIRMRWEERGEGLPLVLVHGIPTSPSLWRHVVPLVSKARCLAWEMVGYGGSIPEGRDRDISVARQADYLLAWLQAIGIERAVLAGHDLGGGVVQIVAVRQPGVCAGLFLTNAIGYDSWPIPSVKAMRAMGALLRHLPDPLFKHVLALFYRRGHDDPDRAAEALAVHWPFYADADGAAAFIRQVRSLRVEDTLAVADRLPELRLPARIVWGADDQFQKIRYGERLARDLAAPLQRIDRGKHFTPEDHPEIVARDLNQLLEAVREQAHEQR